MKSERSGNILVIDDDNDVLYTARLVLRDLFGKVDTLARPGLIPDYLKACRYDLILLDMNFSRGDTSGKEGIAWLGKILEIDPETRVITTTAYGEIGLAVQAMKKGAVDFIIKPWNKGQLITSVQNALSADPPVKNNTNGKGRQASEKKSNGNNYPEICCRSISMLKILETIKTVAPTDANVLILGENGTGKELVAWSLHRESLRKNNAFVHVDLGAVPETLFESELFGHTRGAFTDAKEERKGRFEMASGGTLFLDEIGNLTMPMQAKILTTVQKREVVKIGNNNNIPVDVRVISATNKPLYQMADSFEFRQDLLYRINTVEILIPPLRERKEDIGLITEYYLRLFSEQYGKQGITIRKDTMDTLEQYHWPGNIRELAHAIERAVIFNKSGILIHDDFALRMKPQSARIIDESLVSVEDYERKAISNALTKYSGNLSKAADELGVARTTLYRKIAHFGIGF